MKKITIDMAEALEQGSSGPGAGGNLAGRETGREVRSFLAGIFMGIEEETVFLLDFKRIGVIDYSCADELLAKLMTRVVADEFGPKYICLINISSSQIENISVALEKRGLAVAALPDRGGWTYLGKLNPYLRETFNIVYDYRRISARELSGKLSLAQNTGSTRLLNLYKQRLVGRHGQLSSSGCREYVYVSLSGGFGFA